MATLLLPKVHTACFSSSVTAFTWKLLFTSFLTRNLQKRAKLYLCEWPEYGYLFLARRQNLRHTKKNRIHTVNVCKSLQLHHPFYKKSFSKNYCHLLSSFRFYVTRVLCKTGFNAVTSANREAQ